MSGSTTTYIPGAAPTVVLPVSTPMKLPTTPAKPTQKSRIKNTPRRGKVPGIPFHPNTQQTVYTQANRNTPSAVPSVGRPVPAVPVILNSQSGTVNTPSVVTSPVTASGTVPVILNSQSCSVNTPSAVPRPVPTSVAVPVILNSQACSVNPPNGVPSVATAGGVPVLLNSQACNHVLLVSEAPPNFSQANFISQVGKTHKLVYANAVYTTANSKLPEVKPENPTFHTKPKPISVRPKPVVHKNKPVLPKGLETPANFVIPNQTLSFPVETPTSVGYSINITDILPPKPNQLKSPAKLKPSQRVTAQLLPEDPISVKNQPKMMAPQPAKMAPVNSFFQFQPTGDAEDIAAVIPITIIGPNQQPLAIDSSNAQFFSQALPQLVPFQTLAPAQDPPKLDKLPEGMENATVHGVDVIDVAQDESAVRAAGNSVGEIHHGLTKSVPEPYAADILSQLTSDGSLPAISSSQVSSVLSALDAPQPDAIFQDQLQSPPTDPKEAPALRKSNRKAESRQKQKEEDRSSAANKLVERVQCFKCRFCLFLTLDQAAVTKHIEEEHSSHLSKSKSTNDVIPCPGCSNVFISEKSFSVHLSEDHKVAVRELNDIMSTLVGCKGDSEEESPKKSRKEKIRKSAKIRVRNLMKDAVEPAEETPEEAPSSEIAAPVPAPVPAPAPAAQEDKAQHDIDDHDYATTFHDSDDSGNETAKKRGRRRKRGSPRKKRKANTENEDEERFMQNGYKCNVSFCAVRMNSHDNLVYHQRCHKKEEAKTPPEEADKKETDAKSPKSRKMEYMCPECSKLMKSWVQMSGHLWRSHGIDMELHSCDQCEYKTPSLAVMVNLHQRIHGSERPFACDACDKTFKTTKQLRNHKVVHANKMKAAAGEASACEECGRRFIDNRLLRSHISAVHKKEKPFNCPTCGYSASNRSTLKMHLRLHTGEKPFSCKECSYTTADHNSLRRHNKRHTGDKPYKCPYCFYACIQSSTYKVHLRTKHSGQGEGLMFSCESCPFHTVSQDMYKAHVAQHKAGDEGSNSGSKTRRRPKAPCLALDSDEDSSAVATAAVTQPLPIILSFSTDDAHASEAPNMHDVVEEVSEAIIPGSDLHLLYSNFSGLSTQQSTEATANVYGSQSEFVMMMGDSVIQVVEERNSDATLVAIAEERITGDLGELQENDEDLKFKLSEEVRS